MYTFIVKQRPVCAQCGKKCGQRHRNWPVNQNHPDPWDGVSWRFPKNPFCTLGCALTYGRSMHAKYSNREKLRAAS